jgi:hypothetical protein
MLNMATLMTIALFFFAGPLFRGLFSGLLGAIQAIAKMPFIGRPVPAVCSGSLVTIPILEAIAEGGLLGLLLGMVLEACFPFFWLTKIAVFSVLFSQSPLYLSLAVGRFFPVDSIDLDEARRSLLSDPTLTMVRVSPRVFGDLETAFNFGFLIMYDLYVWEQVPSHPRCWAATLAVADIVLWISFWWILTRQGRKGTV